MMPTTQPMNHLVVRSVKPSDAMIIQAVVQDWWGRSIQSDMLSTFFLTHFRETCLMAEQSNELVGFLIGFLSQTIKEEAYIRLVVVKPDNRGEGIGRALYERFFEVAQRYERTIIRSVTSPSNRASVAFHTKMGFLIEPQEYSVDGFPVCCDYHGRPGTDRILFTKHVSRYLVGEAD